MKTVKIADIHGDSANVYIALVCLLDNPVTTYPFLIDDTKNPLEPIVTTISSWEDLASYIEGWGLESMNGQAS